MINSRLELLFVVMALAATTVAAPHPKKKETKASPIVVFFDDFSGTALDRSKWNVVVSHSVVNNEQQAYVDSSATVYIAHGAEAEGAHDGALVIKPVFSAGHVTKEGRKFDFLSGRLDTRGKVEFTYGTLAARMKLPLGEGYWPAFWALGVGKWPDCGEIDMMETVGDSSWVSHAMHGPGYFGNTPIAYRFHFPQGVDVTQWHIYSVNWTADHMIFSVDGKVTYTVTRAMVEHYGRWAYDNPKYIILNFALGGGYPYGVNKVTTPYYGLSQSTVDKIKQGKAIMQVDWVLVTKN